ncbi:malonate decarboxylase beta subunit [Terrimicrobium sacchariphilum]|uniref:Malonate decarboxylase beta subunit n=1 Tax=Terrimicrobium sacchariphilum TaxID=690879 RepID=A0A146GAK4_TERSA|nr:biotin-independent malonate decarboxylase subunit beta [Terrimicrobium sacchariphilum]GAT33606.1 malonate decarboxylase beta subunit [Terrimicrobium sacchariphilum]
MKLTPRISFYEASARQRVAGILDAGSFREILPPTEQRISPHLGMFGAPVAFDDGAVVGEGTLGGKEVYIFAQEGKFRGGSLGEVHAAKITGLLRLAAIRKPAAVLGLFDSGGVRLEEANAGEIGSTEIMRAILEAQCAGIPVIGLLGGSCGCFGGSGITSSCCDALVASEEARLSVSGPEVIETVMGVEAFDSRDRALVWRTTGGKNRFLFGKVATLVDDHIPAFRAAAAALIQPSEPLTVESLRAERVRLARRIDDYGSCTDARQVWRKMGLDADRVPDMTAAELTAAKPA